jgi:mRNA interferase HigB
VHIISRKKLLQAAAEHSDLGPSLDAWYRVAKRARWQSLEDVRVTFPSADGVGQHTVFNIKGNHYRVITEINYRSGRVFIREVLTHAEYNKGGWRR